jgi:hypothetical protein
MSVTIQDRRVTWIPAELEAVGFLLRQPLERQQANR